MSAFHYDLDPPRAPSSPPPPPLARLDRDELARLADEAADCALTAQENADTDSRRVSREAYRGACDMLVSFWRKVAPDGEGLPALQVTVAGGAWDVIAEYLRSWAREVRSLPVAPDPPSAAQRLHAAGVAIRCTQARYPGALEMVMLDFDAINPRIEVANAWRDRDFETARNNGRAALVCAVAECALVGYHVAWGGRDMISVSVKRGDVKP